MNEWKKVSLDQMGTVSRGKSKHRPRNDARLFGGKYPFIQTGDIGSAGLYVNEFSQTYNEEGLAQSKLWEKDTLCITIAANIADTALLAFPACFPDSIMGFVADPKISNVKFVKYCFDILQRDCKQISQGAAQDNLSWKKLSTIEFPCPPIEVQHRIATILSRYDSLIENYQKQIKLLEEAAQRLYKEWFIDLRFPGHEKTKIVDGVPEGWEKKPALDFFEMSIGKTPPRTQKQWFTKGSNGIPWVSISDMKDTMFVQETAEELTQDACENYNIKVIPKGTILLSFKLTVGRVAFAGADVCTNEAIAHFQKEGDEWKAYTLMYLRNYNYDSLGNTSGISKAVNSTIIKNMPFVMPCTAILQEFSQRVLPFIKQTENLQSQLRLLTEARDRLLPKLMNGEITV